jgi:hypothetical protein
LSDPVVRFVGMGNEGADYIAECDVLDECGAVGDDAELLAHIAGMPPGPFPMTILSGIDPMALDGSGRLDYAREWHRQHSWVTAQAQSSLAAVMTAPHDADQPCPALLDDGEMRASAVSRALNWTAVTTVRRLRNALRLVEELPATHALLASGAIEFTHALVMLNETQQVDPAVLPSIEARVLGRAPAQTAAQFGRSIRRAILAAQPDIADIEHAAAVADREVHRYPIGNGMSLFGATLSATDAELVFLALDACARKAAAADGDTAIGIDARRADALVGWALAALANPDLPKQHGRPAELRVTIDLPTLLGVANNPAELAHYGAIPASVARQLAGDAKWRRFVTEPLTGALLDYGRTVYRPPQALADYVLARDKTCRFPGCSTAAERGDIDHAVPYEDGGNTSASNCHALCRRHHRLKTFGGWAVESHANGAVTWTSPFGARYPVAAENHGPSL